MSNYWNTTSIKYIVKWTSITSYGKAYIKYTLKK